MDSNWDLLFKMQHYGVPTRLLDWSENLLAAAYFALMAAPSHDHEGDCLPIVWCLDPVAWNRGCPNLSTYEGDVHILNTSDDELEAYKPLTEKR